MKKWALVIFGLALGSVGFGTTAHAACGSFEVSKGDIKVQSAGKIAAAAVGAKICSGDTVIAGPDSRAKIKMQDGNELNVSPDSKIVIEDYQYNPADNKKKVLLNILKGKVRATTREENMYNDKAKDGQANTFQIRTKSAVAGVRGTDFLTSYDPSTNKTAVVTFQGKVEFGQPGAGGEILNPVQVGAGQKTEQTAGQAPEPPKPVPPSELKSLNSESKAETKETKSPETAASDKKEEKKEEKKDEPKLVEEKKADDKKSDEKKDDKRADGRGNSEPVRQDDKKDDKKGDKRADGRGNSEPVRQDDKKSASQPTGDSSSSGSGSQVGMPAPTSDGGATSGPAGSAPAPTSDTRYPSSSTQPTYAPPPTSGSMLNAGDLPTSGTFQPPPTMPSYTFQPPPNYLPPMPAAPVCDYCNTQIQTGPGKLNITINVQ